MKKPFTRFINKYPAEIKYGVQGHDNLFLQILYFDNYVVCNINSDDVYKIVASCLCHRQAPPSQTEQTDRPPFLKISNTHKVRWHYSLLNRLAERTCGEATMRRIIQATYHIFPNWLRLVMSTLLVLGILETTVLSMFFRKYIYSVLRTTHQKIISIILLKVKFQNAHSIQHIKHLVHKKWKHWNYNCLPTLAFLLVKHEDAFEYLMLLIESMDKGFGLCPTNDYI